MGEVREKAIFAGVVALLVGVAGVAYFAMLGPAPAPLAPGARPGQAEKLVVAQTTGEVAIRRGGKAGPAEPAVPGATLRADDVVETGPDGVVSLEASGSFRVELESGSLFAVKEITAELARFRLASGLASASVRDDPVRSVEIEAGTGARAKTRGGDLRVSATGRVAALAVTRGEAELSAGGRVVVVRAGQQALSVEGGTPSAPAPIPSSLLLKVVWPAEKATNQRRLTVTGRTAPGAVLALQGRSVKVEPDGTFRHVVYLREGRQRLTATGRDVAGHEVTERSAEILLDTRGAPAEFETDGLWKDRH